MTDQMISVFFEHNSNSLGILRYAKFALRIDKRVQNMHNQYGKEMQTVTELRSLRLKSRLTQKEAARKIGISLRSYVSYENEETLAGTPKYRFLLSEMRELARLDEEHGTLTVDEIRTICNEVLKDYPVQYCYLFGSYAKGKATATSDVDLLISSEITGLRFYELTEKLRESLRKKIDLLDVKQLAGNAELLNEVLKDGIKLYG